MGDESLALQWRPVSFRDLCGQPAVQKVLFMSLHEASGGVYVPRARPKVGQGLLFTGSRGTGKTSTARILAAALNCAIPGERPCGSCTSCEAVRNGTHPAVTEIDAASNGTVDKIRDLHELVSYDCGYPFRVVLLDEVHSTSKAGFDALLKLLEEPPPDTVFVLLTTEAGKVPRTIASRCSRYTFRTIPPAVIRSRLEAISTAEGIAAESALLAHIAEQADGGLRDAVVLLEQCAAGGILTMEQYRRLHGEFDFAPFLLYSMAKGDHKQLFSQVDHLLSQVGDYGLISSRLVACLRDLLVLHAGGEVPAQGDGLERRKRLAALIPAAQAVKVLRVLWDLRIHFRSADPRSSLELAAVMCAEVLHPVHEDSPGHPHETTGTNGSGDSNGKATAAAVRALVAV